MGFGTSKQLGSNRGVNKKVRDLYNGASRGDKAKITRLYNGGTTTPAAIRRALGNINERTAPRRANTAQLRFDRSLAANPRRAATIRNSAPEGVDARRGRAGMLAARQNVQRADRRRRNGEAAVAAATPAAAPRAPRRTRTPAAAVVTPAAAPRTPRRTRTPAAVAAPAVTTPAPRRRRARGSGLPTIA